MAAYADILPGDEGVRVSNAVIMKNMNVHRIIGGISVGHRLTLFKDRGLVTKEYNILTGLFFRVSSFGQEANLRSTGYELVGMIQILFTCEVRK